MLAAVHARETKYFEYSAQFSNTTVAYDVGIVLLAAGSVAAAVFSHGLAKGNLLAGLGIGAGSATVLWTAYKPDEKRTAYRDAGLRASCVYTAGIQLAGDQQTARAVQLQADISSLDNEIAAVKDLLVVLKPDNQKDFGVVLAAQAALPKAYSARDVAVDETNAYASRTAVVWNALVTIEVSADASSKTAVVVLSDAKNEMTTAASAPKVALGSLPVTTYAKPKDPFVNLQQATDRLLADSSLMASRTYFSPTITRIKACSGAPIPGK
jgi:hypothetical protein